MPRLEAFCQLFVRNRGYNNDALHAAASEFGECRIQPD
jgi:hypothetical protein